MLSIIPKIDTGDAPKWQSRLPKPSETVESQRISKIIQVDGRRMLTILLWPSGKEICCREHRARTKSIRGTNNETEDI